MQLARQNEVRTGSSSDRAATADKKPARAKKDARAGTIAAIHITWAKLRRDLKGDKDGLRESRLAFMSQVLGREVKSSRDLTQSKLGKVLDAMRDLERAPLLPGTAGILPAPEAGRMPALPAEIHHLATEAQAVTVDKLFLHLGWRLESIDKFVRDKFKANSHRMLTPAQANSLTFILLRIAASRAIKDRDGSIQRVSNQMIRAEIPQLKRRLGIDQGKQEAGGSRQTAGEDGYDDE